jgi:hypothetical protein
VTVELRDDFAGGKTGHEFYALLRCVEGFDDHLVRPNAPTDAGLVSVVRTLGLRMAPPLRFKSHPRPLAVGELHARLL